MKSLLITLTLACTLIGSGTIGLAADMSPDAPKAEKKGKHMPFKGKVSAVDKTAMTLTLEGKEKARTFYITSETRINKDGNPAVIGDIKAGDAVSGAAVESAAGKWDITKLNIGKKGDEPATDAKKPAKKSKKEPTPAQP
jgi:hypothetical protein